MGCDRQSSALALLRCASDLSGRPAELSTFATSQALYGGPACTDSSGRWTPLTCERWPVPSQIPGQQNGRRLRACAMIVQTCVEARACALMWP